MDIQICYHATSTLGLEAGCFIPQLMGLEVRHAAGKKLGGSEDYLNGWPKRGRMPVRVAKFADGLSI